MTPVRSRSSGESFSQRAATAPAMLSGFHLGDVAAELLERLADFAREAGFDRLLQRRVSLAHDPVHGRGLHAGLLQLRERLAGVHGIELLGVADQHDPGDANDARDPEQVAGLDGGGERSLVDHQDGLGERRAHFALAFLCKAARRHPAVAGEEPLQRLGLDACFGRERLRRRGRGREPHHAVAAFLGERPDALEHGGLAGAGVALDAHDAVLRPEDQLHGFPLPFGQRTPVQTRTHYPASHHRATAVVSIPHQADGLPLVGERLVGGHAVARFERRRGVERSGLLEIAHRLFGRLDGDRAGPPGQRRGQQVGTAEHGLALGKMSNCPFRGLGRRGLRRSGGSFGTLARRDAGARQRLTRHLRFSNGGL